jgi:hypothetical protein
MYKAAKAHAKQHRLKAWILNPYLVTAALFLLLVGVSSLVWRFDMFRPYIVGIAAGLAAFLAPIPGLLTPETRGKWVIAIFISAFIGVGTWYSADTLEREKDTLQLRLESQNRSFELAVRNLSNDERDAFIKNSARRLKTMFDRHEYEAVLDLADIIAKSYPNNGHALYYRGDVYRIFHNTTEMRGSLTNYLAAAELNPDALDGPAAICYDRASGFCRERTAWINHLLASDFYHEALGRAAPERSTALMSSFKYENRTLELRSEGFDPDLTVKAPCDNLKHIAERFAELGQNKAEIDADLKKYCP